MDRDYSPREVIGIIRRRRWAVLTAVFVGLGLASAASLLLPKAYRCSTRIEVSQNRNMPGAEYAAKVDAVREQLLSMSTMSHVVEVLGLDAAGPGAPARQTPEERRTAAAKSLINATRVEKEEPVEGTYYIRIETTSPDADTCHKVLETLVSGYRRELYDRPRLQQQDVVESCRKSFELGRDRVDEAQRTLTAYEQEHGELLGPLESQLQTVQQQIGEVEQKDLILYTEQFREAEEYLASEPQYHEQKVRRVDSVRMAGYDTELNRLRIRLNELIEMKRFTEEHPELKSVRQSIREIEQQKQELEANAPTEVKLTENQLYIEYSKRKSEAQANLLVAKQLVANLRKSEKSLQDLLRQVPPIRAQRDRLAGELKSAQQSLDDRNREMQKAEDKLRTITDERQLNVSVVDPPIPPKGPAGPPPIVFALGGMLVGGAAGLGVAWLIDAQDRSFREVDAVAEFLGVPSLAAIHAIETPPERAARRSRTMRRAAMVALLGFVAAGLAGFSVWSGVNFGPSAAGEEAR